MGIGMKRMSMAGVETDRDEGTVGEISIHHDHRQHKVDAATHLEKMVERC